MNTKSAMRKAFDEGRANHRAMRAGLPRVANPYAGSSVPDRQQLARMWVRGFLAADDEYHEP